MTRNKSLVSTIINDGPRKSLPSICIKERSFRKRFVNASLGSCFPFGDCYDMTDAAALRNRKRIVLGSSRVQFVHRPNEFGVVVPDRCNFDTTYFLCL